MSFRNKGVLWEYAPALRALIPLVAGIILYDRACAALPLTIPWLSLLTLVLLVLYGLLHILKIKEWLPALLLQLFFVWTGILLCAAGDDTKHAHWMGRKAAPDQQLMGIVRQQPQQKSRTLKIELTAVAVLGPGGAVPASGNALVYCYKAKNYPPLNKGDTVLVPHRWEPIHSSGNPFGLDYPQYCRRKNIHLQQFTDRVVLWSRQHTGSISLAEKLRLRSLGVIKRYIHEPATAALLEAMLLGEEQHIDPDMRQSYSDTGIIHVISISGAHIAVLFFVMSFGLRTLRLKKPAWITHACTIALIWCYITLAGMPVPAIRAATMFTLLAAGYMVRRQHHPLNQLFVTALIMLLLQPMWLFSIGFQLSFAAVLSLILFYKPLLALWPARHPVWAFLARSIAASIAAEILVAPLVAYYFHSFPLMFLPANLVAALTMGLILCLGWLLLLLAPVGFAAQVLATVIVWISGVFHYMVHLLDKVDVASLKTLFISPLLLVLLYLLILSLCMIPKSRVALWAVVCCLLSVSALVFVRSWRVHTQKRLIVSREGDQAHAELLLGPVHYLVAGTPSEAYGARMNRIGFGANTPGPALRKHVWLIDGHRVVVADSSSFITGPFPADILLLTSAAAIPDTLLKYCRPRLVVCAAGSRAETARWEKACAARRLAFHSVRAEGAFIFP